jgi:hypothetical protein
VTKLISEKQNPGALKLPPDPKPAQSDRENKTRPAR